MKGGIRPPICNNMIEFKEYQQQEEDIDDETKKVVASIYEEQLRIYNEYQRQQENKEQILLSALKSKGIEIRVDGYLRIKIDGVELWADDIDL